MGSEVKVDAMAELLQRALALLPVLAKVREFASVCGQPSATILGREVQQKVANTSKR